jgi:hypothetical protein
MNNYTYLIRFIAFKLFCIKKRLFIIPEDKIEI